MSEAVLGPSRGYSEGVFRDIMKGISKKQELIYNVLSEMYPFYRIEEEFHIGERLRLDIFVPDLGLAVEYHGRQHYEFVPHFHITENAFEEAKRRDKRKREICEELGIVLIVFTYKEKLTEEYITGKINVQFTPSDTYTRGRLEDIKSYKNVLKEMRRIGYERRKKLQKEWMDKNKKGREEWKSAQRERARILR